MLQQIVHGQNIRTTQAARDPKQVRNVNHVALQAPHDRPESEIPLQRVVAPSQLHRVEVRRQRATFRHLRQRSDEKVFALAVQARQRADHVPDIGANSEFRHATDVDGYFHSLNLTTGSTGVHREFTGGSSYFKSSSSLISCQLSTTSQSKNAAREPSAARNVKQPLAIAPVAARTGC